MSKVKNNKEKIDYDKYNDETFNIDLEDLGLDQIISY